MLTDDIPGTGGRIKECPEDFVVDEIPAYDPSGQGDHVMLRVRKRGLTTDQVARILAETAGVRARDVGFAGRKDKHAVTTQWFSIPSTRSPSFFGELEGEGWEVLDAQNHRHKLRTGHLKGNRFRVIVRGVDHDALDRVRAVLQRIESSGLPNAFGPQRFGRRGDNIYGALRWIEGTRRPPRDGRMRKLMISSLQAVLFNRALSKRLQDNAFTRALQGDIIKLHTTGGMFVANDPEEVTERMGRREVSPTGPIFGARMWWPEAEALEMEMAILEEVGLQRDHLDRFQRDGRGSRRLVRVFPRDIQVELEGDALSLSFELESGVFATTLIAEITKAPELRPPDSFDDLRSVDEQLDDHPGDGKSEDDSDDALSL